MPQIPILQLDAFTDALFGGNPAAVVPLVEWLPDAVMQLIAAENNLPETAFFVPQQDSYHVRWFTPTQEVDLCGHATLAAGWVVLNRLEPDQDRVTFYSRSGPLTVRRDGPRLAMDFPSRPPTVCEAPRALLEGLAAGGAPPPILVLGSRDYLCLFEDEAQVRVLKPDFAKLMTLDRQGVIVTARGSGGVDFVSRYFGPRVGIPEDPVTGSAHSTLIPFWADRLKKETLNARQVSARGGALVCALRGDRVEISGEAMLYLEGTLTLPLPDIFRNAPTLN